MLQRLEIRDAQLNRVTQVQTVEGRLPSKLVICRLLCAEVRLVHCVKLQTVGHQKAQSKSASASFLYYVNLDCIGLMPAKFVITHRRILKKNHRYGRRVSSKLWSWESKKYFWYFFVLTLQNFADIWTLHTALSSLFDSIIIVEWPVMRPVTTGVHQWNSGDKHETMENNGQQSTQTAPHMISF